MSESLPSKTILKLRDPAEEIARIQAMITKGPHKRRPDGHHARSPNVVPKNAATIVVVRGEPGSEEVIMGRRNRNLKFMPGALVFPGGRVDRGDWRVPATDPLRPEVTAKLMEGMRGKGTERSAHGLAIAAIRELWEETGICAGRETDLLPKTKDWHAFAERGLAPSLEDLRLLARAITPPGIHRRFDTWFFIARLDATFKLPASGFVSSGELEELCWIRPHDALTRDTREITRVMLVELMNRLESDPGLSPDFPIPCYTTRNGQFRRALL